MNANKINYIEIGHVYLIEDKLRGLVKIGCSSSPQDRVKTIINSSAAKGRTFISHKITNRLLIEKLMHEYFSNNRVISEWFKIDFETAKSKLLEILPEQITDAQIEQYLKERELQSKNAMKGISEAFDNHFKEPQKELEDYYSDAAGYLSDILVLIKNMHKVILTCRPSKNALVKSEILHGETIDCMEKSIANISILHDTYVKDSGLMDEKQRATFLKTLRNQLGNEI